MYAKPLCVYFMLERVIYYSVLSATTGSFFAALREGITPANMVNTTLITISTSATCQGKYDRKLEIPVKCCRIALMGMHSRTVINTPNALEAKPMMIVSALNYWLINLCQKAVI